MPRSSMVWEYGCLWSGPTNSQPPEPPPARSRTLCIALVIHHCEFNRRQVHIQMGPCYKHPLADTPALTDPNLYNNRNYMTCMNLPMMIGSGLYFCSQSHPNPPRQNLIVISSKRIALTVRNDAGQKWTSMTAPLDMDTTNPFYTTSIRQTLGI